MSDLALASLYNEFFFSLQPSKQTIDEHTSMQTSKTFHAGFVIEYARGDINKPSSLIISLRV